MTQTTVPQIGMRPTLDTLSSASDQTAYALWLGLVDHGIDPDPGVVTAAAHQVLLAWELAEDRQIPLDPANLDVARGIVETQRASDVARSIRETLDPAASVVIAALDRETLIHSGPVSCRLDAPGQHVLLVVRIPGPGWHEAVHSAACAWLADHDAAVRRTVSEVAHQKPSSGYGIGKKSEIDAARIVSRLERSHVVLTVYDDKLPAVIESIADAMIDLRFGILPSDFAAAIAPHFDGQEPTWPDDLDAGEIDPLTLKAAIVRSTNPDHVHRIVRSVSTSTTEGGDEIAKRAAEAKEKTKKEKSEASSDVSYPTSPVLRDLAGYGTARAWGETLAEDLAAYRSGEIAWSDVDAGCLLHGPSGTGKTLLASAIAATCGVPFIATSFAQWQGSKGGHLGDVTTEIQRVFELAAQNASCIVFIDEIDSIPARGSSRHHDDYWRPVVNALLECLDGTSRREGVVVIAACNDPSRLDPALVRSGRLDRRFEMGLPDEAALVGILAHHLPGIGPEVLEPVATTLAGTTSGADAARIAREARRIARRAKRHLEAADLLAIAMPTDTRSPELQRRIAVHEAGHAVAMMVLGRMPVSLSLVAIGGSGARVMSGNDRPPIYLLGDVQAEVVVLLAGRAAEEVVLGQASVGAGGSAGEGSDLEIATQLLASSQAVHGLGGYLVYGVGADSVVIEERLRRLYAETLLLVGRHRVAVEMLAAKAVERRVLGRRMLVEFAEEFGFGSARR